MPLTQAEQLELEQLEAELGVSPAPSGLTQTELLELQQLEAELGPGIGPDPVPAPRGLEQFSPEIAAQIAAVPEGALTGAPSQQPTRAGVAGEQAKLGFLDIGTGITQRGIELLQMLPLTKEMEENLAATHKRFGEQQKLRSEDAETRAEEFPVTSLISRGVGQAAGLPVGGVAQGSAVLRVGSNIAAGALAGFVQPTAEDDDPRVNALIGAGTSGALEVFSAGFSPIVRRMINAKNGIFTKADAKRLIEEADKQGIPIFTDDVINHPFARLASAAAEEVPIAGTSAGRVRQAGAQKEAVSRLLDGLEAGVEGADDDIDGLILEGVKDKFAQRKITKNKLWERFKSKAKDAGNVPLNRARAVAMKETVEHVSETLQIPPAQAREAVRAILAQGDDAPAVRAQLEQALSDSLSGDPRLVGELIKVMEAPEGSAAYVTDSVKRGLSRTIKKGTRGENEAIAADNVPPLKRVQEAIQEDLELFAKRSKNPALIQSLKRANTFTEEFNKQGRKSVLKSIVSEGGELVPERTMATLRQGKVSQNKLLYRNMTEQGRAAVKLSVVKEAFDNALDEQGNFIAQRFNRELERNQASIGVFFRGKDAAQIRGLSDVLQATERAGRQFGDASGVNVLGRRLLSPGATRGAAAGGLGVTAFVDPTTAAFGAGTIASTAFAIRQLFQTKTGRDLLTAVGKTTPGTKAYDEALNAAKVFINRAALGSDDSL